jgi:hypothetical protein
MRQLFLCRSQVSFDASGSQDVEAPLFAHEWLFHDGSTVTGLSAERDYPVTLTVIDTAGSTASHTITVTITNVAPTVWTATDVTGVEGSVVQFAATFTDPGVLDTYSALIDWGDGASSAGLVSEKSKGSGLFDLFRNRACGPSIPRIPRSLMMGHVERIAGPKRPDPFGRSAEPRR